MWFQKKKSPPPKPQPTTATTITTAPTAAPTPNQARSEAVTPLTTQQLERRLRKLEEELANLTAKHPQIHIDALHIHQPVLENLTFRLDHLDINELSGSLNLGNNFGAKPNEKKGPIDEALKRVHVSKENKADPRSAADGGEAAPVDPTIPNPERTSTGYRFTPQSKP
ncbi:hypothetical protein SAMN04487897_102483 [Paenibacillus sp. yr247]|uniref:hypothetical protein n=1 Tax=Paenibacillus sp. yr247 TaxID=1761880 RepID=UPI00088EDF16|nr:hypothetical protein [Paenibacillus sp. yr247]SDN31641.1 hypothetical protein SAMN04487897_102483 [Paenibacillus sp. yr247]